MIKNKKTFLLGIFITAVMCAYSLPVSAHNCSSYNNFYYRSTVMGTGINHVHTHVYGIVNETNQFYTDNDVYALTRIFNIEHVNSFRIKHQVYRHGENSLYKEAVSQTYKPNKHWWAETWAYNNLGKLPAGDYELRVLISIDGQNYKNFDSKNFTVRGRNSNYSNNCNNDTRYNYASYNRNYYQSPSYSFSWSYTGTGVKEIGNWQYEIVNQKTNFHPNEDVYVLSKVSSIKNIDHFRIKHDLYINGQYNRSNESPVQQPKYNYWTDNYAWNNFGKLPVGNHEIRTFISVNGQSFTHVKTVQFTVGQNDQCWQGAPANYNCGSPLPRGNYKYDWSYIDNRVENTAGYEYRVINNKTSFTTDEPVIVLTKISNINGIDNFQIRHELYNSNGNLAKTNTSDTRYPRNNHWDYNYYWSDFGRISSGNYTIKIYISINNGPYQNLDEKSVVVNGRSYDANYTYNWTQIGADISQNNSYPNHYQPVNYDPFYYNYN